MLLKLVLQNLLARKARTLLTSLAIALSVTMVVGMTSSFKAFQGAASGYMNQYMGAVDANVRRIITPSKGIDQKTFNALASDREVKLAFPRLTSEVMLDHDVFNNPMKVKSTLVGAEIAVDPLLKVMTMEEGRWFNPGEKACVIDLGIHKQAGLKVGDRLKIRGQFTPIDLPIVGIVRKPGIFASFVQTAYVPLEEAKQYVFGANAETKFTEIRLQVVPDTNLDDFSKRWNTQLRTLEYGVQMKLARASREQMDNNFKSITILSSLAGSVAMASAMFIIFSTLSMGVAERQRTLAMMRAIGTTRLQVGLMVLIEGIMIAIIGIAIGIPAGFGLSAFAVEMMKPMFALSPTIDGAGVIIASSCALLCAIVAGQIPAWQATRVDPLEAMSLQAKPFEDRFPLKPTIIGLLLIILDPILLYLPIDPSLDVYKFYVHFSVGLPCLLAGFFLISPAFVWIITRMLGPAMCAIFSAPYSVVSQQISGGRWRSAGTCAALMVGLGVLVVMQTQGNSSLNAWKLPNKFPDAFIFTTSISGLSPEAQEKILQSEYLKPEDTMPIGLYTPEVGAGVLGMIGTRIIPTATMFVAIDPTKVFRLMELDFREGNPDDAARMLAMGNHVVVTLEYKKLRNLSVGDKIRLKDVNGNFNEFTIAGVVWSPGIDVMVNSFDMGQHFEQQSQACVFGSLDDARKYFDLQNAYLMTANFKDLGVSKLKIMYDLQSELSDKGISVADVRQIKSSIEKGLQRLLLVASSVAWGALIVAGLGVTNAIIASIRSRTWQFGVLRSIGVTRGSLMRIVLIEAMLLGCIGVALGIASGFVMTINARKIVMITLGHDPPITIPWGMIGIGAGFVIAVSLIAALLPAFRVSRTEPLALLQAGRASA